MGNGVSGGLTERLRTMIAADSQIWTEMYNRDPLTTRSVKMTSQDAVIMAHPEDVSFEIELMKSRPPVIDVVALMPGTPRRIVWVSSYGTLEDFNACLNKHISTSTLGENDALIGFCYVNHIFIVPVSTRMRLYIQWAKQIATYRDGDSQVWRTAGDVPLLISTDGHKKIRAIYPLIAGEGTHSTRYLNPERVKWVTKVGAEFVNIFSCDTPRPPDESPPVVVPLTSTEVDNHRERQVLPRNEVPAPKTSRPNQPMYRPADFSEEQDDDNASEFFSVEKKIREADEIQQGLIADIKHYNRSVRDNVVAVATSVNAKKIESSDGEVSIATPPSSVRFTTPVKMDSPTRRTTIPVGLIPREEHRLGGSGKRPVGIKPRDHAVSDPDSASEL